MLTLSDILLPNNQSRWGKYLLYVVLIGFIVRLGISISVTYCTDIGYWIRVSSNLTAGYGLYDVPGYYYMPIWGYVIAVLTYICNALNIKYGYLDSDLLIPEVVTGAGQITPTIEYALIFKLFLIIVDFLVAIYIYRIIKDVFKNEKAALIGFAIWFLSPLSISISAFRVNFDNLEILFMLISVYYAYSGNYIVSGSSMALSLLTKPYGVFLAIALMVYSYYKNRDARDLVKYLSSMLITALIFMLPVLLNGDFIASMDWLFGRLQNFDKDVYNVIIPFAPILVVIFLYVVSKKLKYAANKEKSVLSIGLIFTSLILVIPGNIQYFLVVLALMIVISSEDYRFTYICMFILGIASFVIGNVSIFGEIAYHDAAIPPLREITIAGYTIFGIIRAGYPFLLSACGIVCLITGICMFRRYSHETKV